MPPEPGRAYLAACTIYRQDAEYLAEWIEFHRLGGVERFFLYDNGSTDDHRDVLAPYVEEGIVTQHDWPTPFRGHNGRPMALFSAFEHCAGAHRDDARWIAFLDVDEFLFSPAGERLPEVMRDYERFPGVVVSRAEFGSSGHVSKPDGLVIENYLERRPLKPDDRLVYKSIVEPGQVARCLTAHSFRYRDGVPVDEEMRPIDPLKNLTRKPPAWERLRIHHYFTKSEEERMRKAELWRDSGPATTVLRAPRMLPSAPLPRLTERDETLVAHAPAVRAALARRGLLPS
ncbi:MAG TPA: glycosyltransferase family 92 protein [Solirubrobacterales bacterium]|nr:glycosyltransferase family 92 protein [Solirubrobacterales bacterium]